MDFVGSPTGMRILAVLVEGRHHARTELAELLDIDPARVSKEFDKLQKLGLLADNGKNTKSKKFFLRGVNEPNVTKTDCDTADEKRVLAALIAFVEASKKVEEVLRSRKK